MELRMIRSSSQFPYEEIKQVCLEEKYVKKTVNYKIVGIVQKWLKNSYLPFLITESLKGT